MVYNSHKMYYKINTTESVVLTMINLNYFLNKNPFWQKIKNEITGPTGNNVADCMFMMNI